MVLLIPMTSTTVSMTFSNLHSTMVLLILRLEAPHFPARWIYIPLWFYLYSNIPDHRIEFFVIYIPLWFYLYPIPAYITCSPYHLHSTMVLLIRWRRCLILLAETHLHSTMVLLIQRQSHKKHYLKEFTFHYGSTYTRAVS